MSSIGSVNPLAATALTRVDAPLPKVGLAPAGLQTGTPSDGFGQMLDGFRADMDALADVEPVYETLPGWQADISTCRRFEDLPPQAQAYVQRVEQLIGCPIRIVSVGPDRAATLMR